VNHFLLLGAVVSGIPAVVMLIRHKAPRATAVSAGLTAAFLVAAIPSLLARFHYPITNWLVWLGIIAVFIGAVLFFWYDVLHDEHQKPLFKKKGGQGGKEHNSHVRPLATCLILVASGLMIFTNFHAITADFHNGTSQASGGFTTSQQPG
jgi:hypothetical protein